MSVLEEIQDLPGLGYLASPYSHNDQAVRRARYQATRDAWAWLLQHSVDVISPIVVFHDMAMLSRLPYTADYWGPLNTKLMFACKWMLIHKLDGWKESKGVAAELKYAAHLRIPTFCIYEDEGSYALTTYDTTPHR